MGASPSSRNGAIASINVTPLVDITLVLLIIFMVTARLIVAPESIALDLPKAASAESTEELFAIELLPDGSSKINGEMVPTDQKLIELAHDAAHRVTELRAIIRADGDVPHRRVIHVLDLLRQAGIARVGFGVVFEPSPATTAPAAL
ncbi:MAG TPA: biopolymer transporter ExbD [Polyangiaceae bacterium]|nr:biopolymer transporter ExbD [Polyangiaceae bacterium]